MRRIAGENQSYIFLQLLRIVARVTRTLVGDVSVGLPPTRMSARAGPYGSDAGEYSVLVFAVV